MFEEEKESELFRILLGAEWKKLEEMKRGQEKLR